MEIIAHRGYWKKKEEKNMKSALERAKGHCIGTETDFRDFNGKLVVSHNVADSSCLPAECFFSLYHGTKYTLALNVKADGIQQMLFELLSKYEIENYFCFDMSIPDTLGYIDAGLKFFVRESEYEKINELYENAEGVWIDGFKTDEWISFELIGNHRRNGKKVCIVSSELHGRNKDCLWKRLKIDDILKDDGIILCTDFPEEAKEYFYGQN